MELRKILLDFSRNMEIVLQKNDYKGTWKDCDLCYLENKLIEEIAEYFLARQKLHVNSVSKAEVIVDFIQRFISKCNSIQREGEPKREIIDVANLCMMIWDHLTENEVKSADSSQH